MNLLLCPIAVLTISTLLEAAKLSKDAKNSLKATKKCWSGNAWTEELNVYKKWCGNDVQRNKNLMNVYSAYNTKWQKCWPQHYAVAAGSKESGWNMAAAGLAYETWSDWIPYMYEMGNCLNAAGRFNADAFVKAEVHCEVEARNAVKKIKGVETKFNKESFSCIPDLPEAFRKLIP